jgi:hypothetical protein
MAGCQDVRVTDNLIILADCFQLASNKKMLRQHSVVDGAFFVLRLI